MAIHKTILSANERSSVMPPTDSPAPSRCLRLVVRLALLLVIGTASLYAPSIRYGFVSFDDPDCVIQNTKVLRGVTWENLVWAFGTDNPAVNWHSLTWISQMLDVTCYGANRAGHHLTNVSLFPLDIVILFLFLERSTSRVLCSATVPALADFRGVAIVPSPMAYHWLGSTLEDKGDYPVSRLSKPSKIRRRTKEYILALNIFLG
jgi:hypothetical protein